MTKQQRDPSPALTSIALIQMSCRASREANLEKAIARIADAAESGAQIICLQELFHTTYPCQQEDHDRFADAVRIPGPTTQALSAAAEQYRVVVVGSLFEQRAEGVYHNTAIIFERDGNVSGMYRKMHIPDDPQYYEKFYFTPGDLGFRSFSTTFGNIGLLVCWDQWFPEAARLTAMRGSQVIVYPTAIGWLPDEKECYGPSQQSAWETMLRSHAIANGVFVAAPNRVGREESLEFWGGSLVIDPYGNVLARGSHDREETIIAECDFSQIEAARTHWPFFRDRRIDAYEGLSRVWSDERLR